MDIINEETTNQTEDILTSDEINEKMFYIMYNETKEMDEEIQQFNYHKTKECGYWKIAKMIIAHSIKDKNNTDFYMDFLDKELENNNDSLENIEKVIYTNNLDINTVYEFKGKIAKYIVENLKICKFKPLGYIFNNDASINEWSFTISVITNKSIYTSNRYINENKIGFY